MPTSRKDRLDRIAADGAFDVAVVGGGINGIGVFRELALQGLRVLLVERSDFCSGCSAAPSRMIHGGLRYLENGELSLVKESLAERDDLLRTASHMVRPLPTAIPIVTVFSGLLNAAASFLSGSEGRPARRGALPIKIGLTLYDLLTGKRRALAGHTFRGRQPTREQWPDLADDVRFSASYFDAWISHPERLGLELVADAEAIGPTSVALNYTTLDRSPDGSYRLVDMAGGGSWPVSAGVIINATGAWLDDTKATLSDDEAAGERLVEGTKGSHLVLNNPEVLQALRGHMLYYENADRRICIAFPYLGRVLAGATDIRVDRATRVRCEVDERDYILESLRGLFPGIAIDVADVVYSFSGIRPLPRSAHAFTGRISRGHATRRIEGSPVQICMIGGKWTTFRAFAEQACDEALAILGKPRVRDSKGLAIGGGKDFPAAEGELERRFVRDLGVDAARAAHLASHYGTHGAAVHASCSARADDTPLVAGCPYTRAEIAYLVEHEQVVHLADMAMRRTDLAITGQLTPALLDALADVVGEALGWTSERRAQERATLVVDLENYHGVCLASAGDQSERSEACA